ncbi:hypothetical protein [Streptomyces decoyicus]
MAERVVLEAEVHPEDLAFQLATSMGDKELIALILCVDERKGDYQFSETLIQRLQESLEEDE